MKPLNILIFCLSLFTVWMNTKAYGTQINCPILLQILIEQRDKPAHASRFSKLAFGRHPESLSQAAILRQLPTLFGRFLDADFSELLVRRTEILMNPLWRTGRELDRNTLLTIPLGNKAKANISWMVETLKFEKKMGRWKISEDLNDFYSRASLFLEAAVVNLKDYQDLSFDFAKHVSGPTPNNSGLGDLPLSYFADFVAWWPTPKDISTQTIGQAASLGLTFVTIKKPSRGVYVDGRFVPPGVATSVYFSHDLATHQQIVGRALRRLQLSSDFQKIYPAGVNGLTGFRAFLASIDFFSSLAVALDDTLRAATQIPPTRLKRLKMYPFFILWEGMEIFERGMLEPIESQLVQSRLNSIISRLEDPNDLGHELQSFNQNGPVKIQINKDDFIEDLRFLIQFRNQFVENLIK